jgi:DNA-binding NarL/FixJ family response regulator
MLTKKDNIHILIVDDHPVVTEGLQKILAKAYSEVSTLSFTTGKELMQFLRDTEGGADLILLDIRLPDINGAELCKQIKTQYPDTYILAFSNHNERSIIMRMLENGASGYLLKNASADELIGCIDDVLSGHLALCKEAKEILARPSIQDLKPRPALTKREKEILQLIGAGKTSSEIGQQLHLSPLTIETHRRNLMQKYEAKNIAALIKLAMENGML